MSTGGNRVPAAAAIRGTGGDDNISKITSSINIRVDTHPGRGRRIDSSVRRKNNVEQ